MKPRKSRINDAPVLAEGRVAFDSVQAYPNLELPGGVNFTIIQFNGTIDEWLALEQKAAPAQNPIDTNTIRKTTVAGHPALVYQYNVTGTSGAAGNYIVDLDADKLLLITSDDVISDPRDPVIDGLAIEEPASQAATETAAPDPPTASTPSAAQSPLPASSAEPAWVRRQFGTAWTIAYPDGWQVNTAGLGEGALTLQGDYRDHRYEISLSYPIFSPFPASLDAWVNRDLAAPPANAHPDLKIVDTIVAGIPAKKALNVLEGADGPVTHRAYIWQRGAKNPSLVVIRQLDPAPTDATVMEQVLDQFLAGITE